jgi:hypothetical protein
MKLTEKTLFAVGVIFFLVLVVSYVTNTFDFGVRDEYLSLFTTYFGSTNSTLASVPETLPVPETDPPLSFANVTQPDVPLPNRTFITANDSLNAELYVRLVGRSPPDGYTKWTGFARGQCDPDLKHYMHLLRLFDYWHARGGIFAKDTQAMVGGRWASSVERGVWKGKGIEGARHKALDSLRRVYSLLSSKEFRFMLRFHDEPTSLPAPQPIRTVEDVRGNKCVTQHLAQYLDLHGYFMAPQLLPSHVATPILSNTRLPHCTLDLPLALNAHYKQVLNKDAYIDAVAWADKRDALFHRGSLTGGYFNTPHWRKYHRVRLLAWAKEYATKHPGYSFHATADPAGDAKLINSTHRNPFYVDLGIFFFPLPCLLC